MLFVLSKLSKSLGFPRVWAFQEFGFSLKSNASEQFLSNRRLLRVGVEPSMVDVMNFFDGVDIDEVFDKINWISLEDLKLPFVSRDHLILNKLAVGRPRDLADVDELKRTVEK